MKRYLLSIMMLGLMMIGASGCVTTRSSTTPRTAIERALISESYQRSIAAYETGLPLAGKTFVLETEGLDMPDKAFPEGRIRLFLLRQGLRQAIGDIPADIQVQPRVEAAGIDDSALLVGIPSFEIPVPPMGSVSLPEVALFKRDAQRGRSRLGLAGVNTEDGSLAFDLPAQPGQASYLRLTAFFFITWRWTDLGKPF